MLATNVTNQKNPEILATNVTKYNFQKCWRSMLVFMIFRSARDKFLACTVTILILVPVAHDNYHHHHHPCQRQKRRYVVLMDGFASCPYSINEYIVYIYIFIVIICIYTYIYIYKNNIYIYIYIYIYI